MHLLDCLNKYSGLYTLREASIYAQIPIATLRYWFIGNKKRLPVRRAIVDDGGMFYITFQDFIEAVAIRELRTEHKLSLPKIREAVIEAREQYKIDYPFSSQKHRTRTDGKELHIYFHDIKNPVQLSGKNKRQTSMAECIAPFMKRLLFDSKGIAYEYVAAEYGKMRITINPNIMLGSPRVNQSPYSAITLWRAKNAEGDISEVARIYGIDRKAVLASCKYCEKDLRLVA